MARGRKAAAVKGQSVEERLKAALVPEEEWPYPVPENWCWVKWGSCGNFLAGNAFKPDFQNRKNLPIPFYKVGSLKFSETDGYLYDDANTIDESIRHILKATLIPTNSTIFAKIGEAIRLNRRCLNKKPCCIDNNLMAFVPHQINFKFAYYFSRQIELYKYTNATTVPAIRKSDLENISFPLPPLTEQQRIVDRIESLFAKLDEAKEKAQAALDSFESRRAAILHKAFTGELTAKWREKNGVSLESWEFLTLKDIADYKKGPFGSSITKAMFVPKGENTYKVYEQGNAIRKTVKYGSYYISSEKYLSLQSFAVAPGDIIISCAGTIGEVFILPEGCEKGVINQALMRVRINNKILTQFFIYLFDEMIKKDINDQANGTAIKNIPPFKVLKAMPIRLPSTPEQSKIIEILDDLFAKEQQTEETVLATLDRIDLIKKSILARAFRGELGTNDPTEESSLKLLEQILAGRHPAA